VAVCGEDRRAPPPTWLSASSTGRPQTRLWVTGITEHPTREGKVYCCVQLDVFSRRLVGWAIDSHQATPLVAGALGMA
jgi:transposase InsO family protein